jgi:hypothetical protein
MLVVVAELQEQIREYLMQQVVLAVAVQVEETDHLTLGVEVVVMVLVDLVSLYLDILGLN